MSIKKEIKKQIDSQTREKIGNVKIKSESSYFAEEAVPDWAIGRTGESPVVIWSKTSYSLDRGSIFQLNPNTFNDSFVQKSTQFISTKSGNVVDNSYVPYYNVQYSGWAGIKGGGTVSLSIRTANSSVSVWIDGEQIYVSDVYEFKETNVTFNIATRSLVQIFWYSVAQNNSFTITGDFAKYLSYWETVDLSPFAKQVEWYPENPITSDSTFTTFAQEYIKLRWWFGEDTSEGSEELPGGIEEEGLDNTYNVMGNDQDVGGFGVWSINFQDAAEIDVLDENTISIYGYYPNLKYIRLQVINSPGVVYKVDYVEGFTASNNRSNIVISEHGLTDDDDGRIAEVGIMRHVIDIPMSTFTSVTSDIYETMDMAITRGTTYYYLVDTFDTSSNKNRGGITSTYQSIVAGDFTAPNPVTGLTATRNSFDSVTVRWDDPYSLDVKNHIIYTDTYSSDFTVIEGTTRTCNLEFGIQDFQEMLEKIPGGVLISIELVSGGNIKYVRYVTQITGSILTFNEAIPSKVEDGDIVRFLSVVDGTYKSTISFPTPPPADYEIVREPFDRITL
jgi:hypothetical protein